MQRTQRDKTVKLFPCVACGNNQWVEWTNKNGFTCKKCGYIHFKSTPLETLNLNLSARKLKTAKKAVL
jgi:Zn-finger protein